MFARVFSLMILVALGAGAGIATPYPAHADPVVTGEEHCVVNVPTNDVLNMRYQPSATSPIVAQKPYASCGITITGECYGNWCPAEDGHSSGWMHRRYLAMVSPALYCVTGVSPYDVLNVRAYPSATSQILLQLPPNQCGIAFLPYAVGNWQKIRVAGWEGWANRTYLSGQ